MDYMDFDDAHTPRVEFNTTQANTAESTEANTEIIEVEDDQEDSKDQEANTGESTEANTEIIEVEEDVEIVKKKRKKSKNEKESKQKKKAKERSKPREQSEPSERSKPREQSEPDERIEPPDERSKPREQSEENGQSEQKKRVRKLQEKKPVQGKKHKDQEETNEADSWEIPEIENDDAGSSIVFDADEFNYIIHIPNAGYFQHMMEIISRLVSEPTFEIETVNGKTRISTQCMDTTKTAMISVHYECVIDLPLNNETKHEFCICIDQLPNMLKSAGCVNLTIFKKKSEEGLRFRVCSRTDTSEYEEMYLNLLDRNMEKQNIDGIPTLFTLDFNAEKFRNTIKVAKSLKIEDLRFQIYVRQPPLSNNTSDYYLVIEGQGAKNSQYRKVIHSVSNDLPTASSINIQSSKSAETSILPVEHCKILFDSTFSLQFLDKFFASLRDQVVVKLKKKVPMILQYQFGKNKEGHITLLLADKVVDNEVDD